MSMSQFFKGLKKDIQIQFGLDVTPERKTEEKVSPPPWYKPSALCSDAELIARARAERAQQRQEKHEKLEAPIRERQEKRRLGRR